MSAPSIPNIVKDVGTFNPGSYADVVAIDFNMLILTVLEELQHPEAQAMRRRMDSRRVLFTERPSVKDAKLRQELDQRIVDLKNSVVTWINAKLSETTSSVVGQPSLAERIVARSIEVVQAHIQRLEPYGTIVGNDIDSIYFSPNKQHKTMLENNGYLCPAIPRPHSAIIERRAKFMVVYGFDKYAIETEQDQRRIYRNVDATRANLDLNTLAASM
jgi:hypothetical protein